MGLFDGFAQAVAQTVAATLTDEQKARATALILSHTAMPDADSLDRIRLARFIITGSEDPPPLETTIQAHVYPFESGDVTVLGPQIFASTPEPQFDTVINWRGMNFAEQVDQVDESHPDDPGPTAPDPEPDPLEPAPMAGTYWQGHRGGKPT